MQVVCGHCGRGIDVDDRTADSCVSCPRCRGQVAIPRLDEPEAARAVSGEEAGFAEQARLAMERRIRVKCGSCGRWLQVNVRLAGKQLRCPACQAVIQVPADDRDEQALAAVAPAPQPASESVEFPVVRQQPVNADPPAAPAVPCAPQPAATAKRKRLLLIIAAIVLAGAAIVAGFLGWRT